MGKKIISFSLWGENTKYTVGAIENAILARRYFPEWICRFYLGQSTLRLCPEIINRLKNFRNVELIEMREEGDWTGMFWRFLPCSDLNVEYILSRDTDSRLSEREKVAVEEWLHSGREFHIIRDHPWHKTLIMGGLWGAKTRRFRDMKELIENYDKTDSYNIDQRFLAEKIYPRIKRSCFVHDEFVGAHGIKFPRKENEFIGQVISAEGTFDQNQLKALELYNDKIHLLRWYERYVRLAKMKIKGFLNKADFKSKKITNSIL